MSFTRAEAQDWANKYSNVTISHDSGGQIQVEVRDPSGTLIWRDWSFVADTSTLEVCIKRRGIPLPVKQDMVQVPRSHEKLATYFGIKIVIDKAINYLAADSDGIVWGYALKPDASSFGWVDGDGNFFRTIVMKVDLNGIDWTTTLMEVK